MQEQIKHRESWADYAKCFAIYLMVLCHFNLNNETALLYIWIFHMPVFFLISGYFDKAVMISKEILIKNCKSLIIPYFFFSICNLTICWVSPYIHPELYFNDGNILHSIGRGFLGMFLMEDTVHRWYFMPCYALWFLAALFEIRILFSVICFCWQKSKIALLPISILVFATVYNHFPFFSADSAGLGLIFYIIGYLFKHYSVVSIFNNKIIASAFFVFGALYLYYIGLYNGKINMDGCEWGNSVVLFYVNGVIGSLCCISLAKLLPQNIQVLSEVGSSTLTILGTHGLVGIVGKTFCVAVLHYSASDFPVLASILLSCIAVVFGIYTHKILLKHIPWAVGK